MRNFHTPVIFQSQWKRKQFRRHRLVTESKADWIKKRPKLKYSAFSSAVKPNPYIKALKKGNQFAIQDITRVAQSDRITRHQVKILKKRKRF